MSGFPCVKPILFYRVNAKLTPGQGAGSSSVARRTPPRPRKLQAQGNSDRCRPYTPEGAHPRHKWGGITELVRRRAVLPRGHSIIASGGELMFRRVQASRDHHCRRVEDRGLGHGRGPGRGQRPYRGGSALHLARRLAQSLHLGRRRGRARGGERAGRGPHSRRRGRAQEPRSCRGRHPAPDARDREGRLFRRALGALARHQCAAKSSRPRSPSG